MRHSKSQTAVLRCIITQIFLCALASAAPTAIPSEPNEITPSENQRIPVQLQQSQLDQDSKSRADKQLPNLGSTANSELIRQNKMMGYFPSVAPYMTNPAFYQSFPSNYQPFYYEGDTTEVDEDYANDIFSRANRRRPTNGAYENSPIYYIRLPPTPYMFVPGFGYISQPPQIQAQQMFQPQPQQPPQNPFINLQIPFVSNGKPENVYNFGPQFPSYLPPRPTSVKQKPSYVNDSKIHHLKGQFLFNGRPENIYLMQPNPFNPFAMNPYTANAFNANPFSPNPYITPPMYPNSFY